MSELWQPFENLFLHEVGMKMSRSEIAEKLERSESAITRRHHVSAHHLSAG
ncbi:hypothetical protein [Citrobacter freundii]|uniref:hypothetical protein n=1 Tax=Citrobacter freundii TaxID=546 RepID=UPI00388DBA2A